MSGPRQSVIYINKRLFKHKYQSINIHNRELSMIRKKTRGISNCCFFKKKKKKMCLYDF